MDCESARRLLLEADIPDLLAESDSELSRHLRTCAACRRAADLISRAERGLDAWLSAAGSRGDASFALAQAAATARRRAAIRRAGAAGGLAAAAVLAGILLVPRGSAPPAGSAAASPAGGAAGFFVTAPPGRDVVVLHTANPNIVVVWFPPSRRSS